MREIMRESGNGTFPVWRHRELQSQDARQVNCRVTASTASLPCRRNLTRHWQSFLLQPSQVQAGLASCYTSPATNRAEAVLVAQRNFRLVHKRLLRKRVIWPHR